MKIRNAQITAVEAFSGSGKSYYETRWIMEVLLRTNQFLLTNLPLKIEEIIKYCLKRKITTEESIRHRILILPESVIESWKSGKSTILSYMRRSKEVSGDSVQSAEPWFGDDFPHCLTKSGKVRYSTMHFVIDEAH